MGDTHQFGSFIPSDAPPPSPVRIVCRSCGYDLSGLDPSQSCPECGVSVQQSLMNSDLLVYSPPEYTATLHRGVFLVVAAIIGLILSFMGLFAIGIAAAAMSGGTGGIDVLIGLVSTACTFVVAYGWWLLSTPDPASREGMKGERARKIVRICTIISVAIGALSLALAHLLPIAAQGQSPNAQLFNATNVMLIVLNFVGLIANAVAYFAQMLYVRWLAPRLPDEWVHARAKLLLWLGPLLMTVGIVLIGLGPVIALVLYWNMLDRVRKDLKAIRAEQEHSLQAP